MLTVGLVRGTLRDRGARDANLTAEIMLSRNSQGGISFATMSVSLPLELLDKARATPGVKAVTPIAQHVEFGGGNALGLRQIDGVDFEDFRRATGVRIVEGRELPLCGDAMIVDVRYAAARNTKLGDKIRWMDRDFTVVGVYEPETGSRMMIPLRTMQEALGAPGMCSMFLVKCERPEEQEEVARLLLERMPDSRIIFTRDLPVLFANGFTAFNVFLDAVLAVALAISLLIILLTTYTTVTERTRQIGILKALGASKRFIAMIFIKESTLVTGMGVACGFLIALLARLALTSWAGLHIEIEIGYTLWAALGGFASGLIGAIYPALRAAGQDAVEALSYE
ncbi:MAG TPA: FtsX-like permease family protein [Blastocatellia bacterium]|jgi:putative ABC transport system permease protein|nr:FtsX-like permease family protein [Blastocatellia bacterium]